MCPSSGPSIAHLCSCPVHLLSASLSATCRKSSSHAEARRITYPSLVARGLVRREAHRPNLFLEPQGRCGAGACFAFLWQGGRRRSLSVPHRLRTQPPSLPSAYPRPSLSAPRVTCGRVHRNPLPGATHANRRLSPYGLTRPHAYDPKSSRKLSSKSRNLRRRRARSGTTSKKLLSPVIA